LHGVARAEAGERSGRTDDGLGAAVFDGDTVRLIVDQTHGRGNAETVIAIANAGIDQVLAEVAGGDGSQKRAAVIDIDIDRRIGLAAVPSPTGNAAAIDHIDVALVYRLCRDGKSDDAVCLFDRATGTERTVFWRDVERIICGA